jgi:hypothetical protein
MFYSHKALQTPSAYRRIILKMLGDYVLECEEYSSAGSYEQGHEPVGSTGSGGFLD